MLRYSSEEMMISPLPLLTKLLTFFDDLQKRTLLKVELAIVVDFGDNFVKTTYLLESDSPLVFRCYEA